MFNLVGQTLGKYRLLEQVGQGGMAQVYKAYQPDLERSVAIKVLHPHLTSDPEFATRFRREARAIAALEHPHIVRVYDFDAAGEFAFLVMEYLEGVSLKQHLHDLDCRGERMPLEEVERIVSALADALDYAHRQGVIHRDLKPSNIVLTPGGRPVLTDFGIAQMVDATVVTGSGGTLGTPAYMSPEQGQGEPGDARSDVYALGVLLYQLCTGRLPYDADTPYAVILKHITAPLPAPRALRPDLPESVERVILKALAKEPDARFQTAGELGRALSAAMGAREIALAPVAPRGEIAVVKPRTIWLPPERRRVALQSAALVILTIVVCVALFIFSRPLRVQRYLAQLTSTPASEAGLTTLLLEGPDAIIDTWLDPDKPDAVWQDAARAQLQGPDKADRVLMGLGLSRLPPDANVISATLTLHVEAWDKAVSPCRIVAYRMLTLWRPTTATYNSPWSKPGLLVGSDYESMPIDRVTLPNAGTVTLDVIQAVVAWQKRGRAGGGLLLMLSDNSDHRCHYWVDMTEQVNPADRPTLHIVYKKASP